MSELELRQAGPDDVTHFYDHERDPEALRRANFPARDRETFVAHWERNILGEPTVLDGERDGAPREEVLLKLYGEVCGSWRALVDVRFKLLGLVPAVSVAVLAALLLRRPADGPDPVAGLIIALFGLMVTGAITVYDQRNSQLHDELISRARRIEHELGIAVGQFLGRPKPWRFVNHGVALAAIYGAAATAWTAAAMYFAVRL